MPTTKKIDELNYIYVVSRIRAIEKKLLSNLKFDRMVDSKTPDEALKTLLEADYGLKTDVKSALQYEELLKEEYNKVYQLLSELAPEPDIINMFLMSNDYHNIKVFLKSEFSGQESTDIIVEPGSIPVKTLEIMIQDRNLSDMSSVMRNAVEDCIETFGKTKNPQIIDLIMDKAQYTHMKELAEASGSEFINDLIVIMIDICNLRIFLRIKNLKKTWDFLQKILIPGGEIDTKVFVENLDGTLENFLEALRYTRYGDFLEESIDGGDFSKNLTKFEKLCDNFIISFVKKAKFLSFGIEPLIGYLIAKETEIKNARIIMVGKINDIPNEKIRERLREAYV
ncbi:V-type ATP synthase subunit C [Herbivorax sp. ANBcel31]|uniref:V-type ATP synthase subunit C n=1 Tax=Herbivorax sp. ANBcel31 TaxID=3069754 RepID=UPI0027B7E720|nr:V-type ATP synthase subunit C [Herbivorax sp. ANBcel31]MDQ2085126.1 V-type ATP synthase subunit C [Herbivorax sp. ANBcel31]